MRLCRVAICTFVVLPGALSLSAALVAPAGAAEPDTPLGGAYPLTRLGVSGDGERLAAEARVTRERFLSELDVDAEPFQRDPLEAVLSVTFPASVRTVRDAAHTVLEQVGYELLEGGPNTSPLLGRLLEAPLPLVTRRFEAVRAREILGALAGRGYVTVVDHVNRRLTFDPRPLYAETGDALSDVDTSAAGPAAARAPPSVIVPASLDGAGSPAPEAPLARPARIVYPNVPAPEASSYRPLYADYAVVDERRIVFAPDSSALDVAAREALDALERQFDPRTDLVSVLGCAHGPNAGPRDNAALAAERAGTLRRRLLAHGLPARRVLDEACWSDEIERAPGHAALVALRRRR